MKLKFVLFMFLSFNAISAAFSAKVLREKDVEYSNQGNGTRNLLDVYYPEVKGEAKDVLVFIHGGSWDTGKKDTYWWLGRNFVKKNVVVVTINYRLAPAYQFGQMAMDAASAVAWVKSNIKLYGGDPERIFVMGHSAGGHLAALINSDPKYFREQGISNPIRGIILNDGFGLDMHEYLLTAEHTRQTASFRITFSEDQDFWKKGSPITYASNINNPHLLLVGERTYPTIKMQSKRLSEMLAANDQPVTFIEIPGKKHIGMISQMVFGRNELYAIILNFMSTH